MNDKPVKRQKRRQYFIAKKFQLKYVGLILLLMFATAALCAYVVYYTSMFLMGEKLANVYPQGRLVHIVKIVNFRILLSLILVTPLVVLIGIFLSHRIAGPIYRMEKFLHGIALGDLTSRMVLRSKDELTTLANGMNFVVDTLKSNVVAQKARLNRIMGELHSIRKAVEGKAADAHTLKDSVNRLDEEIKGLDSDLDKYKL